MSIQLELTATGPQLASALMRDDEELAYAFDTMAEEGKPARMGVDIAGLLPDPDAVIDFLRALADAIEAAK